MKTISNVLSIEDAIINRRSVRGYLKKEVPILEDKSKQIIYRWNR